MEHVRLYIYIQNRRYMNMRLHTVSGPTNHLTCQWPIHLYDPLAYVLATSWYPDSLSHMHHTRMRTCIYTHLPQYIYTHKDIQCHIYNNSHKLALWNYAHVYSYILYVRTALLFIPWQLFSEYCDWSHCAVPHWGSLAEWEVSTQTRTGARLNVRWITTASHLPGAYCMLS